MGARVEKPPGYQAPLLSCGLLRIRGGQRAAPRLVADVGVLLAHAHHHALVARAAHDGREHRARRVVAGESSLRVNAGGNGGEGKRERRERAELLSSEGKQRRRQDRGGGCVYMGASARAAQLLLLSNVWC
jgi:hypothetical protein